MRWLALLLPLTLAIGGLGACDDARRFPNLPARPSATTTDDFDAGVTDGPPPLDAPGLCGNELHETGYDPPNVYFVLDRSGSMATEASPDGPTRYAKVRAALIDLVRTLGPLIEVGAAIFPRSAQNPDPCHSGGQVFALTQGDSVTGEDGPTTLGLRFATDVEPYGGTPLAATLVELTPTLTSLPGKTVVVLATDGAPNCNANAACGPDDCVAYLEGLCGDDSTCCEPGGLAGPLSCVDRQAATDVVAALRAAGIDVYVVGIPGSALYAELLDDLAVAGGTAQIGEPRYLRVDDLDDVGMVFAAIAAEAITCSFRLADPPDEPGMTNVYLDAVVVPYDPIDGWTWQAGDTVVLHGEACQSLKEGGATTVQVVTGCPTELPR